VPTEPDHAAVADDTRHGINERFVGFAFAGAELVAEIDVHGTLVYAAGAFQSRFGLPPEAFVGSPVRGLIAPVDHDALDSALTLLAERGRLLPMLVRLANPRQTPLALAGLLVPRPDGPARLCLNFALPPIAPAAVLRGGGVSGFARAAEARLRAGTPSDLRLLEVSSEADPAVSHAAIGRALESVAPNAVAIEVARGRYGVLGDPGQTDLASIANLLEAALRSQGMETAVKAHHLPLDIEGFTPVQAARALRHALNVFVREGATGLVSHPAGGLGGYMRQAKTQSDSLRRLIRDGRFTLSFQPIVSLSDRMVHHFEALIRPDAMSDCSFADTQEFVMLAEALGLAHELDLAVARLACEAAMRSGTAVAFNLSGQSVQSPPFRDRVLALLRPSPACRAGLLVVEMTETAEIENVAEAKRTAEALRTVGIPFCLDDFGAGGADVRLLRALNPDIVKLDGSYVPGITEGGRERAMVAGMVEIARGAGAEIVAERTETETELDALRLVGVQYGQGWLFGRPGPLPAAREPSPGDDGNDEWSSLDWARAQA